MVLFACDGEVVNKNNSGRRRSELNSITRIERGGETVDMSGEIALVLFFRGAICERKKIVCRNHSYLFPCSCCRTVCPHNERSSPVVVEFIRTDTCDGRE